MTRHEEIWKFNGSSDEEIFNIFKENQNDDEEILKNEGSHNSHNANNHEE
jgi:hypothetical protein